jgi:hypothetical protein
MVHVFAARPTSGMRPAQDGMLVYAQIDSNALSPSAAIEGFAKLSELACFGHQWALFLHAAENIARRLGMVIEYRVR